MFLNLIDSTLISTSRRFLHPFLNTFREQEITSFLGVFLIFFGTAEFAQYAFFMGHASPTIVWPPTGFALAAVLLWGYRVWAPIALAQFAVAMTSPVHISFFIVIIETIAYTLQPIIGSYIIGRYFNFQGALNRVQDVLVLMGTAIMLPLFAPLIITAAQLLAGNGSSFSWVMWGRIWAGGVLSIMVITPCITTWFRGRWFPKTPYALIERVLVLFVLTGLIYIFFSTSLPQENIFISLYFLSAVLFWIGLRMGPRMISLALFLTMALIMAGSVIVHPGTMSLNQQLFSDELFMIFITPIFLVLATLVEERRIVAKELAEKNTELWQALAKTRFEDKAKSEFLAILGHELRNPLSPVISTLELLKIGEQQSERVAMIDRAEKHIGIIRRLLDDLLDMARIAQRKFALKKKAVMLQEAIQQSVATIESFVESQGVTLSVAMSEESLWLHADSARLVQIFNNVLHNAAKFTPWGGRITLVLSREGNNAVAQITDTGIGVARDKLSRIFESFVSINPASQVTTGLGIGLSLSKRLTEMHGGTIEAHSDGPDTGSVFTIRFPLLKTVPLPFTRVEPVSRKEILNGSTLKILVVDDNEAAAQGIGKLLQYKGHEVQLAYTGIDALAVISTFRPDAVLLDIGLPDINGYEVARRLRAYAKDFSPVLIALTGYGQDEDKKEALIAGFAHHLTKPVGIADIEIVLKNVAAKRSNY